MRVTARSCVPNLRYTLYGRDRPLVPFPRRRVPTRLVAQQTAGLGRRERGWVRETGAGVTPNFGWNQHNLLYNLSLSQQRTASGRRPCPEDRGASPRDLGHLPRGAPTAAGTVPPAGAQFPSVCALTSAPGRVPDQRSGGRPPGSLRGACSRPWYPARPPAPADR